jgi:tetratricopeptide (TPR) repeat protein
MSRLTAAASGFLVLLLLTGCDRPDGRDPPSLSNPGENAPANASANVEAATRLIVQRKFAEAIPFLERALEKPLGVRARSDVLTAIGNCCNELDQYQKSLEYHDRAIREDPTNFKAYVSQGVVYRLLGDYDKASQSYAKAFELAPDYAELHTSMGALAVLEGRYDAAITHLKRAVELDDSLAVAHSNLALAYAAVGRFDEADKELRKAVIRGYHQPEVVKDRIEKLREASSQQG